MHRYSRSESIPLDSFGADKGDANRPGPSWRAALRRAAAPARALGAAAAFLALFAALLTAAPAQAQTLKIGAMSDGTGDATGTEGNAVSLTVKMSATSTSNVTVKWRFVSGTAASTDYSTDDTQTLTFTAGQTSKTVTIDLINDDRHETEETFEVELYDAVGATIDRARAQITIEVDSSNPDLPQFTIEPTLDVAEDGGTVAVSVVHDAFPSDVADITITYQMAGVTATAGADFTASSGTLTFPKGMRTTQTVNVPIMDDGSSEANETFEVRFGAPSYGSIAQDPAKTTVTILDDETPQVTIAPAANASSIFYRGGSDRDSDGDADGDAIFTLTRTGDTAAALNGVPVALTQTRAFLPDNKLAKTVNFAAGSATATLTVASSEFRGFGAGEEVGGGTLTATVQDGAGYDLGETAAADVTVHIRMMVGFSEASYSVGEGDGPLAVTLFARTSAGAPKPAYEVYFSLRSVDLGSATPGPDYGGVSDGIAIPTSAFSQVGDRYEARVPHDFVIKDDERHEGDELFAAVLKQAPGTPDNSTFIRVDVDDRICEQSDCRTPITIVDDDRGFTETEPQVRFENVPESHAGPGNGVTLFVQFAHNQPHYSELEVMDLISVTNGRVVGSQRVEGYSRRFKIGLLTDDSYEPMTVSLEDTGGRPREVTIDGPSAVRFEYPGTDDPDPDYHIVREGEDTHVRFSIRLYKITGYGPESDGIGYHYVEDHTVSYPVTVEYYTRDGQTNLLSHGSATAGQDYEETRGTLTFQPGENKKTVRVPIIDDNIEDDNEYFTLNLRNSQPQGAHLIGPSAMAVIRNSEPVAGANTAPEGLPTISGAALVGETLTASSAGITDVDGITHADVAWQWIANDGTADTDIAGATSNTYTLTAAEVGKTIKVRATWTDGGGVEETLVSAATATVAHPPVTARFENVPRSHDGSSDFRFELHFSEEFPIGFRTLRDDAFEVSGGTVNKAKRRHKGASIGWTITVEPDTDGDVVVTLPVRACDATGAICTGDGRALAEEVSVKVPGPASLPEISVAAAASPVTEGSPAAFTLSRTGDTAAALTVSVSVSESGSMLSGTPASTVTFDAGKAEAQLSLATEDDSVAEADGRVTASLAAGSGYDVVADAASAGVDVYDDDEPVTTTVEALWSTAFVWSTLGNVLYAGTDTFGSPSWSEDGRDYRIFYISYNPSSKELWVRLDQNTAGIPEPEELTLQVGSVTLSPEQTATFARGLLDDIAIVPDVEQDWAVGGAVAVRLTRTASTGEASAAGPGISVADAQVQEAEGAELSFGVTLAAAQTSAVSVRYATSDGTAVAGSDYVARSGTVRFAPGETEKTVAVPVLDDLHDEGSETLALTLSHPFGAQLADATATGTIVNTDPIPKAWIARFGRTVAEQVIEAVEARMQAPRVPGVEVSLAGQRIGGPAAQSGTAAAVDSAQPAVGQSLAEWFRQDDDPVGERAPGLRTVTGRDLLTRSSFSLAGGTEQAGTYALWGRGAATRFDGREGGLSLDGEVTSGMLGADWSQGAVTAGLVVSRSLGEGGYSGESGNGRLTASLTGLYPWGRYGLSERLSIWALAGYGEGALTLTPEGQAPIGTDLDLAMAAAGLRGVLAEAPETGGIELALKTDAMSVRTSTSGAPGLAAEQADVSRLRLGLEGSRSFRSEGGARLTPSVEIGVRHDGGDAETGFGVDIGGGLAWSDPRRGVSAELRGRGLLSHAASGFRERGFSGSLSWDPTPETARGLTLTMSQTVGAQAAGGMDALLERGTLAGLAANDNSESGNGLAQRRFELTLGYGLAVLGERFTSTPEVGLALSNAHRTYTLGWSLGLVPRGPTTLELSVEAERRASVNDNADPEHAVGVRLTSRF